MGESVFTSQSILHEADKTRSDLSSVDFGSALGDARCRSAALKAVFQERDRTAEPPARTAALAGMSGSLGTPIGWQR